MWTFVYFKAHIESPAGHHTFNFIFFVFWNYDVLRIASRKKRFPMMKEYQLKRRLIRIVMMLKSFRCSICDWLCQIIMEHNFGFLIYSITDRKKNDLRGSVFLHLKSLCSSILLST